MTSELSRLHLPRLCLDVAKLGPAMAFSGATSERAYTLIFVLDCPVPGRSLTFSTEHTDGYLALFAPGGEGARAATVKEAAMSHGFWHLGRFAAHYRGLFGENPADTLARRR